MRYVLGVDGGGTKTYTVITDEKGNKLGEGLSGRGNHQGHSIESTMVNIKDSIDQALEMAGLDYCDISFAQFGLAGADRPYDFSILLPALETLPFKSWDLVCDTYEGLRIGSKTNTGVVLVCGTGTNAAGRNKDGLMIQTGGMGYLYGDGAGGSDMAQQTFRAAVRSWEFREGPTILTKKVPEFFGFENMEQLVNDFLDREIYRVSAKLTVVLHEAANEGDEVAIRILRETGKELGIAANSVIKRLGGFEGENIPIVLVGSVFQKGRDPHLLDSLKTTVEKENKDITLVIPEIEPVYGSVLLAMDHLGIEVAEEVYEKFESYKIDYHKEIKA
ncbi:N-acetylglucosamine kinase [Lederbergia wuyishanensis]|uniref:N-acetylglucosamine kinase-like BadF-type ATPase n=1 Tax=Lederbergia wuyishanensis TaxID=1347903 RepID=A0ABU0D8F7_9BACI|nr:BadF/BadG/BcrA/BcrD ATPase family protein [Lederbergia wuyishanensis]MCJ8009203.1 ATPase [Lederbergia wuyishanensis]MDQ0344667.1 N-acetylglucosamine kinase-like BadF-type ATPase [Lederbergia wuyishanensis]